MRSTCAGAARRWRRRQTATAGRRAATWWCRAARPPPRARPPRCARASVPVRPSSREWRAARQLDGLMLSPAVPIGCPCWKHFRPPWSLYRQKSTGLELVLLMQCASKRGARSGVCIETSAQGTSWCRSCGVQACPARSQDGGGAQAPGRRRAASGGTRPRPHAASWRCCSTTARGRSQGLRRVSPARAPTQARRAPTAGCARSGKRVRAARGRCARGC